MCGICGIARTDGPVDTMLLQAMNAALFHRGPDEDGFWCGDGIGLAMRRLRVIDLVTGRQPVSNEDETIQVVFNGEIYNYQSLRERLQIRGHHFKTQSDTEVLCHAYEEYGLEFVRRLNGMFAFALYDIPNKRLILARDRTAQKPLFYCHTPDGLTFASELKALLHDGSIPRRVNDQAIYHYLSLQYVPGPDTIIQNVYQLPPGHYAVWQDNRFHVSHYFSLDYRAKQQLSAQEWVRRTREQVTQAVKRQMVSDVPLGAFLSGGVDSSIVTAVMARQRPVKTFSIGFDVDAYSETNHARRIAQRFSTHHHEFIVSADEVLESLPDVIWYSDQPLADTSCLAVYHLARLTRQHVTVALSGDGGDEMFAGYVRYLLDRLLRSYRLLPAWLRIGGVHRLASTVSEKVDIPTDRNFVTGLQRLSQASEMTPKASILAWGSFFTESQKQWLASPDWWQRTAKQTTADWLSRIYDNFEAHTHIDKTLGVDFQTYLADDLMMKADRMSMAHSLEVRAPYLDDEVLTLASIMPAVFKMRGLTQKWALREAFRDLLPLENTRRIKRGFGMPVASWLKNKLHEMAYTILTESRASQRGYFVPGHVAQLLDEHRRGQANHGQRLWALLVLELWLRQYVDGERLPYAGC
jgi:asparagine synthase (glutamine-hydrolysing)